MSDRITVAQALPLIARVAMNGIPSSDPRVITYINEATQRLMNEGKIFVGMVAEALICTQQQCFTLPTELENAMEIFIPDSTLDVPTGWYTIENGSTYVDPDFLNDLVLIDRGEYPTVFDVCGTVNLKVYSVLPEAAGLALHVFGTDVNGVEIYENVNGVYQRGEFIPLSIAGAVSQNQFANITNIQKPQTNSPVRLTMIIPGTPPTETLLAIFDRDVTVPTFRRYYCADIPVLPPALTPGAPQTPVLIRVTGKRRYQDVVRNNDYLIISNIPALKMEVMAIDREEASEPNPQIVEFYHKRAVELLENEAKNFQLDPTRVSSRKAQYIVDEQTYTPRQLGYVRAKLCLESPNMLKVGQRMVTRAINNAQQRLISMANWKETVQSLRIKIFEDGWLVLPSQAECLLTVHRGLMPLTIRTLWFESLDAGPGLTHELSQPAFNVVDRGMAPTFVDMKWPSFINVLTDPTITEASTLSVQLFGYDEDNQYISETVALNSTSVNCYLKITKIIKPVTVGEILISCADHPCLAILAPSEQVPLFRRYFVPGLGQLYNPGQLFTAQVKFKHHDVNDPTDTLLVTNYTALKAMVHAVALEDVGKMQEAAPYVELAVKILQNELKAHRGQSVSNMNIQVRGYGMGRINQGR